jgi:mono/diheme cytochrome c family protein
MFRILFGFIVGLALIPAAAWWWLHNGKVPVAVDDPPLPSEKLVTHVPLRLRITREMVQRPPLQPDERTLVAGAHIYSQKCAVCHGLHGKPASLGEDMYPKAPPLWERHQSGNAVGVSDDLPGETYWKVANGIRLTGMPAFKTQLTDTEIWQVTLVLANADKPLPPEALTILRGDVAPATRAAAKEENSTSKPASLDE